MGVFKKVEKVYCLVTIVIFVTRFFVSKMNLVKVTLRHVGISAS